MDKTICPKCFHVSVPIASLRMDLTLILTCPLCGHTESKKLDP